MWRHIAANALTVFIVALIALAGLIGWGQSQYTRSGPLEAPICLQVPTGGSMARVADDLAERGAITNARIFRLGADYSDRAAALKAGSFLIEAEASMEDIVAAVTGDGRSTCGTEVIYVVSVASQEFRVRELDPATQELNELIRFDPTEIASAPEAFSEAVDAVGTQFRVVLAEGVTSWQVVEALNANTLLSGEVDEIPAEGSLAPLDYPFVPGDARADLLADMADVQSDRLAAAWVSRVDGLPLETPEEALILASIIEKETGVPDERRTVASVFINRLNRGMRLQTDPTVIYGVTEGRGTLGRGLRQSELRQETPWNTYVIDGLPPTPIANPGIASIEAALDPETTDLIYFVADGTGGHAFARTLDEHNRNVARWREIEAERANQ